MMEANSKLRESMTQVKEIARTIYSTSEKGSHHEDLAKKIVEIVNAILAAPQRNCDVGTAEEQGVRYNVFCKKDCARCSACPTSTKYSIETPCYLIWAQMPYEEGGTK